MAKSSAKTFPATLDAMAEALAFLDGALEGGGCPPAAQAKLDVIFDEVCSNIVKHSGAREFEVKVGFAVDPTGIGLTFSDDGVPYDPLAHVDPDTTLSAEDRPIGGLGIFMVKKMADAVSYERVGGRNVFAVFKAAELPELEERSGHAGANGEAK